MRSVVCGNICKLTTELYSNEFKLKNIAIDHVLIAVKRCDKLSIIGNFTTKPINTPTVQAHLLNDKSNYMGEIKNQSIIFGSDPVELNPQHFIKSEMASKYLIRNIQAFEYLIKNRSSESIKELLFNNLDKFT